MKIEVEIAQNKRVGENEYVPALIGLIIANPTGEKGPNEDQAGMAPEVIIFIDLTVEQARRLSEELVRHVKLVEEGEVRSG